MRIGWLIYALAVGLSLVGAYIVSFSDHFRPVVLLDLAITAVAYAGLIAYCFNKQLGRQNFWQHFCFAFAVWDIIFNFFYSTDAEASLGLLNAASAMVVFLGPQYVALWLYGYRSPNIWSPAK